jgi:hypothetical protein
LISWAKNHKCTEECARVLAEFGISDPQKSLNEFIEGESGKPLLVEPKVESPQPEQIEEKNEEPEAEKEEEGGGEEEEEEVKKKKKKPMKAKVKARAKKYPRVKKEKKDD